MDESAGLAAFAFVLSLATGSPYAAAPLANVPVNDPALDTTAQDTQSNAVVVRVDATTVLAFFNDSGGYSVATPHVVGWARSTDGGASFVDRGSFPDTANGDAGNAVAVRDNVVGRIYISTLALNAQNVIPVYRSFDAGATLQPPVAGLTGVSLDRPWIAVDNFPGAGQGIVYVLARDFGGSAGMRFARSATFGDSFQLPIQLTSGSGQNAFVLVGADHSVYAFWLDAGNIIRVRRSTTLGASFAAAAPVRTLAATGVNGDLGLGFRTTAWPQAVANPNVAGHLLLVYADKGAASDRGDINLVSSTDFGATWSTPVVVNADGGGNDQFMPTIAVTPDGTHVFVGWYDRRRDPANALIEYWGRTATLTGTQLTFGADFPVSTAAFPVARMQDPAINPLYMGDYDVASADDAFFYVGWGDNRAASAAHTNQPDVRFAKIPVAGFPVIFADGFEIAEGTVSE